MSLWIKQQNVFLYSNFEPMRFLVIMALLLPTSALKAQSLLPPTFVDMDYRGSFANNIRLNDSALNKKWSFNKYTGLSTSFSFFKGGSASVVSAPIGLQLNRRLNNNLFAFAGVSVAPSYINFNQAFINGGSSKFNQNNSFFKGSNVGVFSRAQLGLQYINDDRTFSISGSVGVERSNFPMPAYFPANNQRIRSISANPANR